MSTSLSTGASTAVQLTESCRVLALNGVGGARLAPYGFRYGSGRGVFPGKTGDHFSLASIFHRVHAGRWFRDFPENSSLPVFPSFQGGHVADCGTGFDLPEGAFFISRGRASVRMLMP